KTWELTPSGGGKAETGQLIDLSPVKTMLLETGRVDAAYLAEGNGQTKLYLVTGDQFLRYSVNGTTIDALADSRYPRQISRPVNAVFRRLGQRYAISGTLYRPHRRRAGRAADLVTDRRQLAWSASGAAEPVFHRSGHGRHTVLPHGEGL